MRSFATTSRNRGSIVLILAIAFAAMVRSIANDWSNYDDDLFLFRNPHFDPPTVAGLGYYWTHSFRGLYTPITQTVWWLVASVSQIEAFEPGAVRLNPWTFHALNIAIHCVSSALAFVLIRRVVVSPWAAITGAALFAAHPIQVEAVAWACGTKDLLATMFMLGAIAAATFRRGVGGGVAAIVLAAIAMLSKPSAVVLPAMVVGYLWIAARAGDSGDESRTVPGPEDRGEDASALKVRGSLVVGAMALLAIPVLVVARQVQDVADVPTVPLLSRPLVALDAITMHLSHLFTPGRLCADYGLTPAQLLSSPRRWWTWAVPTAPAAAALLSRNRVILGGCALFLIALLPNLGLATFQFQVYSTVADRYAYPAMLGLGMVVAAIVDRIGTRLARTATGRRLAGMGMAIAILASCILSARQCAVWANAASLWSHTLACNSDSPLANNNLGAAAMAAGDVEGALFHFEHAARAGSATNDFALLNLAQLYIRLGHPKEAADAVVRLVTSYRTRNDHDIDLERQAIDRFSTALERLDPEAARTLRERLR